MDARRLQRLAKQIAWVKGEAAERLAATRRIFARKVLVVDLHTHSIHSDGCDTVDANYAAAMSAGLDFMFATDHRSLRQKRNVRKLPRASWGQEPGAGGHHLGLLHGSRRFAPNTLKAYGAIFQAARRLAPFVWVPHPAGWFPSNWYPDERIAQLWSLEDNFAMEIINGANKTCRAYDQFDAKAAAVWDRLLCDGRRVAALGASDAHIAESAGIAWTGVFAARCSAPAIIRALNAGYCFAGESTLLEFFCNARPMGATVRRRAGAALRLRLRAADSRGIKSAQLICNGRTIREFSGGGRSLLEADCRWRPPRQARYIRLETEAADGLRAFASPVYLS